MPCVLGVSPPTILSRITTSGKLTPNTSSGTERLSATACAMTASPAFLSSARSSAGVSPAAQQAISRTSSSMGAMMPSAVGLAAGFQSYSFTHTSCPSAATAALISVPPMSMPQHTPLPHRAAACRSRSVSCPCTGAASGAGE